MDALTDQHLGVGLGFTSTILLLALNQIEGPFFASDGAGQSTYMHSISLTI